MADHLLLETGDFILLEDGTSKLLVETTAPASFALSLSVAYRTGVFSITATGLSTTWSGTNPFSVTSGPGVISNYSNLSGTSATFDLNVTDTSATPIVIADSNSGTSQNVTPGAGFATFDSSGGTYFTRAALNATKTYPFWVSARVRMNRQFDFGTAYCIYTSERSDGTHGTTGVVQSCVPCAQADDGTSFSSAASQDAVIPDPYWDEVTFEYRSATDRRVYINAVLEATNTTSRIIDLSTGTPLTRIGLRAAAGQAFNGGLCHVKFGTGTLRDEDRNLLRTIGADYSAVAPTSGAITSWYPLLVDGVDVIGGLNMTASGTVAYATAAATDVVSPTRLQAIFEVHKQNTLLSALPTVTAGSTSPISTSGWANLKDVEFLDVSFTGNVNGTWTTRIYHYLPVGSRNHVVMLDGGHQVISDWSTYGLDVLIQQLVAQGYGVAVTQLPLEGPTDPGYSGSEQAHDAFWTLYDSTHNPLERWYGPNAIAMNNLAPRYNKRSIVGLSGGACRAAHYAALDPRINHACVPIRGIIADRRAIETGYDFEQRPKSNGWKTEEFFGLAAEFRRRLWFVNHPTDTCCFGQFADSSGSPGGSYIDARDYDTQFLARIRAKHPLADVRFIEDQGVSAHSFTQWTTDNAILPALALPLKSAPVKTRLGLRAA
jgi:hypothetical protein